MFYPSYRIANGYFVWSIPATAAAGAEHGAAQLACLPPLTAARDVYEQLSL